MLLLDGKATAETIKIELKQEISHLLPKAERGPGLAVILVGEDPASQVYVRNKEKACAAAGIESVAIRLPANISQDNLLEQINKLNNDPKIDGILLQLPLPAGLDASPCIQAIRPDKDVDGLHPVNQGLLALDLPGLRPCTPAGVLDLLRRYNFSLSGKKAVVLGRSNLVGRPLASLLSAKECNATVTLCHSRTEDLAAECRQADFLFLALGKPRFVGADMVKAGAVVIDIGINRLEDGLCGDADYAALVDKVSAMTPVPGGIGPMTIAQLLTNTVSAWKKHVF